MHMASWYNCIITKLLYSSFALFSKLVPQLFSVVVYFLLIHAQLGYGLVIALDNLSN